MSHDARALSSHYLNGSRRRWYVATVCMRARPHHERWVVLCAVTAWPWKRPLGMQAHSAHEVDDARCHLMLPRPGMRWYPCGSWQRSHAHPATCQQGRMRACAAAKLGFACAAAKLGFACAALHQLHPPCTCVTTSEDRRGSMWLVAFEAVLCSHVLPQSRSSPS